MLGVTISVVVVLIVILGIVIKKYINKNKLVKWHKTAHLDEDEKVARLVAKEGEIARAVKDLEAYLEEIEAFVLRENLDLQDEIIEEESVHNTLTIENKPIDDTINKDSFIQKNETMSHKDDKYMGLDMGISLDLNDSITKALEHKKSVQIDQEIGKLYQEIREIEEVIMFLDKIEVGYPDIIK
ncbi:MAG: hypothetical protein IJ086_04450 [Clostridium sp.]|nr:hypothetical protein [Clostridium sp.]